MTKAAILKRITDSGVVVIIRAKSADDVDGIVSYLVEGGITALEITANTPDYTGAIAKMRKTYPNLLIGAGTITGTGLVDEAVAAGAQFIVTPNTKAAVVARAHEHDIPVLMGAMTPTEVVTAEEAGADVVKLFPSGNLGPAYLKSLAKGPFLNTPFFAVGGVDEKNIANWIAAGAAGVGVGGSLVTVVNSVEERSEIVKRVKTLVSNALKSKS